MLPTTVNLRHLLPDVRDQGKRATCVSFTITAAHELSRSNGQPVSEDLCEEVLHWSCKQIDNDKLPATTINSAALALKIPGQPPEHYWPYDENRDETSLNYVPPAEAVDAQVCHQAKLDKIKLTTPVIKNHLTIGCAVALVIPVNYDFMLAPKGQVPMPQPTTQFGDYHAVLLVGYQDASISGVFIFRNSWGCQWGDSGYGYLPYAYVEQYAVEAWCIQ